MQCFSPFAKKLDTGETVSFPCGKCPPCLSRRASGWSFRLNQESRVSNTAFFFTFTYDNDHVPLTKNKFMTLVKRDLQLFFKRLRKKHEKNKLKIKYYAVGEYGGQTLRPHYHAIIFNTNLSLLLTQSEVNAIHQGVIPLDGKHPFKTDLWQNGNITIGHLTDASAAYTLKYMCKDAQIPMHKNDDRLPEFCLMSKGLGANYITSQTKTWHENDLLNRCYAPLPDNKKVALPRYYRQRIYTQEDMQQIAVHIQQKIQQENDNSHVVEDEQTRIDLYQKLVDKNKSSRLNPTL